MAKKTLKDVTVADAYLAIMADRGVEYLFGNAGTDFAPLIESLSKAQALGTAHPKPITCPHENTAQHMAIGYYLATGRPQLTMMHVNVGTANGMNGLLNASRGNIPMMFRTFIKRYSWTSKTKHASQTYVSKRGGHGVHLRN